ncbi:cytosine permease [Biostraticola tofi]|uniref:Cytosine permease n=2 Tax=Biostraticola tofi TaxID=466109 RepID=A0A4R3YSR5_9GAMM|nr:cytosine permease [Biostraticola tofi]
MMENESSQTNDYSFARVPSNKKSDLLTVSMIRIGTMTALGQFMLGATLGHSMTFSQAIWATFLGSMLLEFISLGIGIAAAREGLSTTLLARWTGFGVIGSALVGIVIAFSLMGWFGVQNAIFAHGLNYAFDGAIGFYHSAVITGMVLTILVAFGFRALGWTAMISVPLFFLVIGWIAIVLLGGHNLLELIKGVPSGEPMSLGVAATTVAGGYIVAAVATADLCRYCKSTAHVFWMITLSIILGEFIVNSIAILIAHALDTDDVVTIMTQTAGWIGLMSVILSAVKINDFNIYSSTLALAGAVEGLTGQKWRYVWLTIGLGMAGTLLTTLDILENFTEFLILLGVIFPPIAGVMLCDYYVLRTYRQALEQTRAQNQLPPNSSAARVGWKAIAACLGATAVGVMIDLGIPSLNSLMASIAIYWLLCTTERRLQPLLRRPK